MRIERRYKQLDWFDFLRVIDQELDPKPNKSIYFALLDEMILRKAESISEGGSYRMRVPTTTLIEKFELRMAEDSSFASEEDFQEFKDNSKSIF